MRGNVAAAALMTGLRDVGPPVRRAGRRSTKPGPGNGFVRIAKDSSLRKLMRAANRGRVPAERLQIIVGAMKSATIRAPLYEHARARKALARQQEAERARLAELERQRTLGALDGFAALEDKPAHKPRKSRAKGAAPGDVAKPATPRPHKRKAVAK